MRYTSYILLAILVLPFHTFATISIVSVFPANGDNCDGIVKIVANGTAGPFTVQVSGESNFTISDVSGLHDIQGLCPGNYTISVTSESYSGCSTTLEAQVLNGVPSIMQSSANSDSGGIQQNEGTFSDSPSFKTIRDEYSQSFKVHPNPFTNSFTISLVPESGQRVEVFNALGQLIRKVDIRSSDTRINLGDSGGSVYIVRAYNAEGKIIGTKKVIQVR